VSFRKGHNCHRFENPTCNSNDNRNYQTYKKLNYELDSSKWASNNIAGWYTIPRDSTEKCKFNINLKTECEDAVDLLGAFQGNTPGRNTVWGNWNHVPQGCSVQSQGDWSIHFNEANYVQDWKANRYMKVCRSVPCRLFQFFLWLFSTIFAFTKFRRSIL